MNNLRRVLALASAAIFLLLISDPPGCSLSKAVAQEMKVPSDELVCGAGLAGRVDEIDFSNSQAHNILDFANNAGLEELIKITHINLLRALRIMEARADLMYRQCKKLGLSCKSERQLGFRSLVAVRRIDTIGPAVLKALHDETEKVWCSHPRAHCCY